MDAMKLMTPEEMDTLLEEISEEERTYLRMLIGRIAHCFSKEDHRAVILFGDKSEEHVSVCSVNCEEMAAANMLAHANDVMIFANTQDAPPKEQFN
jgi:uncharacterized ferredoxin-like protein